MKRETGFYWVKFKGEGTYKIGYYTPVIGGCWHRVGDDNIYEDSDFEEIDERRIERE